MFSFRLNIFLPFSLAFARLYIEHSLGFLSFCSYTTLKVAFVVAVFSFVSCRWHGIYLYQYLCTVICTLYIPTDPELTSPLNWYVSKVFIQFREQKKKEENQSIGGSMKKLCLFCNNIKYIIAIDWNECHWKKWKKNR